ncbi:MULTISPECIES: hypothetical protein [Dermacoccus]|uniref:Uncharacterized protein n=3 Tax=Dermacoccus TaxID=57495 RepID=A0A417Z3A5_9MICO|nr:hypothetical protein [Dermacoccus abyssi]RHW45154.1 hypothetical protein D1832_09880 [Dermacoccus abyssi]
MGVDKDWVAINEVVSAGLRDGVDGLELDGLSQYEIDELSSTVTDHLCSALAGGSLVERSRRSWFRRRA